MTVEPSPAPPPTGGRLIRIDAVASRTGKAKRTIYQDIKNGTFPRPRKIGRRAVAWWEHEIDAFNLSRPAA